ncbi:MAG: hypothetical protein F6K10_00925 [Moorea sp. SIO2B7]|nr:hypothetical protein [Moorena sp. SIO2B7]
MLVLSELKKTKVYQEALAEGKEIAKLETIPNLLQEGFNSEKIDQLLNLPLDTVEQIVKENHKKN